jgi:hypothetical protein
MADEPLFQMTITTHKPRKWRFVDLETQEIWIWNPIDGFQIVDSRGSMPGLFDRLGVLTGQIASPSCIYCDSTYDPTTLDHDKPDHDDHWPAPRHKQPR